MRANPPKYRDFWFKIIGCLAISEVIDSIGREDSFLQRLGTKYFYLDLLGGFLIALLLWEISRRIIIHLDRYYDWLERPFQRIPLQLLLGIIVPSAFSFLFTLIYMKLAYDQDIFQTSWLYNEFYTVILFIALINLVYFTWWLYLKWKEQHLVAVVQPVHAGPIGPPAGFQPVLEVSKAGKNVLLPHHEIASAYLGGGYCYIKTFEEEVFVTTYTLDEVARLVDETSFFRANRQTLINRRSVSAYKSIENGKIELELAPALKTAVVVSQKRASEFRKWISFSPAAT